MTIDTPDPPRESLADLMALPELKEMVVLWTEPHEAFLFVDENDVEWRTGWYRGVRYKQRRPWSSRW